MTIATYADLQGAITNWLGGRTDLTSYYADWITLAEAVIARKLRLRLTETSVTIALTAGSASTPSDFLSWRRVTYTTGSITIELKYVHPSIMTTLYPSSPASTPAVFTIQDSTILVMPTVTGNIVFYYYKRNAALSSTLNSLFTSYPDLFLWASLTEAHAFLADTDQLTIAKARRDEIIDEINLTHNVREAGNLVMRPMGATP
jgi:hypothetical protein